MSTESIKTKIAALLAKAEGTDNAYEQDAFMAKVNELLERHQIDMHEIRAHGGDKDPMSNVTGEMTRAHEWPSQVGWALARYYGCRMLRYNQATKAKYTWKAAGRESAVTTFDLMFPFIQSQVRQQARAYARSTGLSQAKAERSVGVALAHRIWALVNRADERRASLEANALVPVSTLDAYVSEVFGETKKARKLTKGIYEGADEYADKVSLNHQATGAGHRQIAKA